MSTYLHNLWLQLGVRLLQRRVDVLERSLQLHAVTADNAQRHMRTLHKLETESLHQRAQHREQELRVKRDNLNQLLQHQRQQLLCTCDTSAAACPVHGSTYRGVDPEEIIPSTY